MSQVEEFTKIINFLKKYAVLEYASINKDFTIDVNGDVILTGYKLKEIPFQFKVVNGDFLCDGCGLTSLKGCPEEVTGLFDCGCNNLTSLEGCPKRCGVFSCVYNKLTSLKGCPDYVQWEFYCSGNLFSTIRGIGKVGGMIYFDQYAGRLQDLKYMGVIENE